METTIYDLEIGNLFQYQGDVYELLALLNDNAQVVCRYRGDSSGLYAVTARPENFNPYAHITKGRVKVSWIGE